LSVNKILPRTTFWSGKKILVTGHTGFKGSWLTLWLKALGADVTGLALEPLTQPNMFDVTRAGDGITSIIGDINDKALVKRVLSDSQPDIVFHLAAQPIVRESYQDPVYTYMTNVMGTAHVLEAVRHTPSVRAVVVVTSDKCYENPEWQWGCREHDAMGGFDPYSSSKGCAELVTSAYRRSFFGGNDPSKPFAGIASARAGNVIGGGDWARDRLIPDLVRAGAAGQAAVIRNPNAVRPWQHVLEPLSGYLVLAEKLWVDRSCADGWNFGPAFEDALTVETVLTLFCAQMNGKVSWRIEKAADNLHEAHLLRLDISKAQLGLGWRPRWTIETAISETAKWFCQYDEKADMRKLTLSQIEAYTQSTIGR